MRSKHALRRSDLRGAPVFDDLAVQQMDLALAAFSHTRIVGDQKQSRAVSGLMLKQAIDDQAAGGSVEISRRFGGEQQFRLGDKGTGDRYPLLLASRELSGIMR